MNSLYKKQIIKENTFGNLKETAMKIERKDGKWMTPENVADLCNNFEKVAMKNFEGCKMLVRGLNPLQWWTLKGYNGMLNIDSIDEYVNGRAVETEKFGYFSQIQIFLIREI